MTPEEIQHALNALIRSADERGGFVHIVDKRQNRFVLKLNEEVRIISYIPREVSNES